MRRPPEAPDVPLHPRPEEDRDLNMPPNSRPEADSDLLRRWAWCRGGALAVTAFSLQRLWEASEAAAALDAVQLLGLTPVERVQPVVALLSRLYAMLTRLAKTGR
jgi:hypothetical protein